MAYIRAVEIVKHLSEDFTWELLEIQNALAGPTDADKVGHTDTSPADLLRLW